MVALEIVMYYIYIYIYYICLIWWQCVVCRVSLFSGESKAIGAAIFLTATVQTSRVVHTVQTQTHDDEIMFGETSVLISCHLSLCARSFYRVVRIGATVCILYIYIERLFQAPFVSLRL